MKIRIPTISLVVAMMASTTASAGSPIAKSKSNVITPAGKAPGLQGAVSHQRDINSRIMLGKATGPRNFSTGRSYVVAPAKHDHILKRMFAITGGAVGQNVIRADRAKGTLMRFSRGRALTRKLAMSKFVVADILRVLADTPADELKELSQTAAYEVIAQSVASDIQAKVSDRVSYFQYLKEQDPYVSISDVQAPQVTINSPENPILLSNGKLHLVSDPILTVTIKVKPHYNFDMRQFGARYYLNSTGMLRTIAQRYSHLTDLPGFNATVFGFNVDHSPGLDANGLETTTITIVRNQLPVKEQGELYLSAGI